MPCSACEALARHRRERMRRHNRAYTSPNKYDASASINSASAEARSAHRSATATPPPPRAVVPPAPPPALQAHRGGAALPSRRSRGGLFRRSRTSSRIRTATHYEAEAQRVAEQRALAASVLAGPRPARAAPDAPPLPSVLVHGGLVTVSWVPGRHELVLALPRSGGQWLAATTAGSRLASVTSQSICDALVSRAAGARSVIVTYDAGTARKGTCFRLRDGPSSAVYDGAQHSIRLQAAHTAPTSGRSTGGAQWDASPPRRTLRHASVILTGVAA